MDGAQRYSAGAGKFRADLRAGAQRAPAPPRGGGNKRGGGEHMGWGILKSRTRRVLHSFFKL
jgi:hypothetical protein